MSDVWPGPISTLLRSSLRAFVLISVQAELLHRSGLMSQAGRRAGWCRMCHDRVSEAVVCCVNRLHTDGAACLHTWHVHSPGNSPPPSIPPFLSFEVVTLCLFLSPASAAPVSRDLPSCLSLSLTVSPFFCHFLCVSANQSHHADNHSAFF